MKHRLYALFAVAFLSLAVAVRAGTQADPLSEKARMLLEYQSFMRGDRDGGVRFSISAVRDLQGTPLAELAVRIALFYNPSTLSAVNVGETEARRILASEIELTPDLRDILRRFVARTAVAAGRREEAMEMHARRGLAMDWLLAGPFTDRNAASFHSRDFPESGDLLSRDVMDRPPDAETFREWRKTPPWAPVPENRAFPFVQPWRWSGIGADGAMLMLTGLDMAEADARALFHIYAETSWRLFVDDNLVAEVDKNNHEAPVEHIVHYPLTAGKHAVVLQLFPPRAGVDPEDIRVALRLESPAAFTWNRDVEKPAAGRRSLATRREARRMRFLSDLQAAAAESPIVMGAYATACIEQKMPDEASWWAETAARANPADVSLQLLAGTTTALNPLLPETRRGDLAMAWHRAALALKPDIVPSLLYLAGRAGESEQPRVASDYLKKAYEINPHSLDVLVARGEWARRFASGATIRAAWDECGKAFPKSASVQLAIASMPKDGFMDMDRRLEACRAAVEAGPYLAETGIKLAEALADSGDTDAAAATLRDSLDLFAGEVAVMRRIAEIYARISRYPDAIAVMSDAVRLAPASPELWRRLGDLHMEAGDQDKAIAFWKTSLAANPGQFHLSDMLDFLMGLPDRFYSEGGYDAAAMTAAAEGEQYPGDVVRLLDRSVLIFAADGSHRRLTHEVDLANTRRGGESLAAIDERDELLTARIVFPNGNTLEPEPFPGRRGLRLPVIPPGAAREIKSLESFSAGNDGPPPAKTWFFQDPSGRTPFRISEFVIHAPRNFPLVHAARNLGDDVDFEFTRTDSGDVYRWTAKLSLPRHEPDAVHISERLPAIDVGVKTTWDEIVHRELRRLDGRLTPSMRMRSLLRLLYQADSAGHPDPEQAARAIYRYVCDNIDPTPASGIAAHIEVDRMGDRATLLLALLRAAGLEAHPAAARRNISFSPPPVWDLPRRDIFPVSLVRLSIPGRDTVWLDVRFDALPFGRITDDLSGATVLAFLPDGPLFETLPVLPAEESVAFTERLLSLPGNGEDEVTVSGHGILRGVRGLARRQNLADLDGEARKRLALASLYPVFPDAVMQRLDILRTGDDDASAQERYEISSRFPLEERPDGVRAVALCMERTDVIADETRSMPRRSTTCHIDSVHLTEDRNVFVLPEGGRFVRLLRPAQIPSRFGVYQLRVVSRGDDRIEVVRNLHIPAQRVPPSDWPDFLAFLREIDLAETQWIEYVCD